MKLGIPDGIASPPGSEVERLLLHRGAEGLHGSRVDDEANAHDTTVEMIAGDTLEVRSAHKVLDGGLVRVLAEVLAFFTSGHACSGGLGSLNSLCSEVARGEWGWEEFGGRLEHTKGRRSDLLFVMIGVIRVRCGRRRRRRRSRFEGATGEANASGWSHPGVHVWISGAIEIIEPFFRSDSRHACGEF